MCGTEIVPTKWKNSKRVHCKKYCSESCRMKASYPRRKEYYKKYYGYFSWQIKRTCKKCNIVFLPGYAWQDYCSLRCSRAVARKVWKKRNWGAVLKEARERARRKVTKRLSALPSKICPFCSKEFHSLEDRLHPYKTYCSKACQIKYGHRVATKRRNEILKNPSLDLVSYQKHLARKKVQDANYKAFNRGCTRDDENHISLKDWLEIKEKHGNKCVDCGIIESEKVKLTIDHVYPLSRGGKNNKNNIEPRCISCNAKKSNKIISVPHISQINSLTQKNYGRNKF